MQEGSCDAVWNGLVELQICLNNYRTPPSAVTASKAVKIKTIHYDAWSAADDREWLNDEYVVIENTVSIAVNMKG